MTKLEQMAAGMKNEGCLGTHTNTPDGQEFDCEYEFAGEITCEECKYGPPNSKRFDPARPREKQIVRPKVRRNDGPT